MSDRHDETEREILRLEEELRQAEMRLDVATLDHTYADDMMVTAPVGIVVDKPAVMAEVRDAAANAKVEAFDKRFILRATRRRCRASTARYRSVWRKIAQRVTLPPRRWEEN